MSKYFEFRQNNSGGHFISDDNVAHSVVIEAENYDEAVDKALDIGIYFDGVENDIDCPCCGDRWYDSENEIELPRKVSFLVHRIEIMEKITNMATAHNISFECIQPRESTYDITCDVKTIFEYMTLRPYLIYAGYCDAGLKCVIHYADGNKEAFYVY